MYNPPSITHLFDRENPAYTVCSKPTVGRYCSTDSSQANCPDCLSVMQHDPRWAPRETNNMWLRFPSGAKIAFGYLDSDADLERYQSAEFHFIGQIEPARTIEALRNLVKSIEFASTAGASAQTIVNTSAAYTEAQSVLLECKGE